MTKLENLEQMAHDEGIHIYDYTFSETKKAACYFDDTGYKAILLNADKIENAVEETIILAEEIGHFATDSLYLIEATANTEAARSSRTKYEAQAKKWAIKKILPAEAILSCWEKGVFQLYEMADELAFSSDYIEKAITYYQSKGELPQNWELEHIY